MYCLIDLIRRPPPMTLAEAWTEHQRLVWWASHRIAKAFSLPLEELVGSMFLNLARVVKTYDDSKGSSFANYFIKLAWRYAYDDFVRHESDGREIAWSRRFGAKFAKDLAVESLYDSTYDERPSIFYHIPEPSNDWIVEILKCFTSSGEAYSWLTRGLSPRDRNVVSLLYQHGWSLTSLAAEWGVSKQRIQQIQARALSKIKEKVGSIERWASLFKKPLA